jgi:hypothetical protein
VVDDPIAHAAAGGSFVCDAPPGYGKSELLARVREAIGDCMVIAPTHTAVRKHPGAMTVHAFLHRFVFHKGFSGTLLIDEYSMLSPDLCAALEHLRDTRIILFGDSLQLPPVVNAWRGQPCRRLHESRLLGIWAGWRRVELKTFWRARESPWFGGWFVAARHQALEASVPDALRPLPGHGARGRLVAHGQQRAPPAHQPRAPAAHELGPAHAARGRGRAHVRGHAAHRVRHAQGLLQRLTS